MNIMQLIADNNPTSADIRQFVSSISDLMTLAKATITERQEDVLFALFNSLVEDDVQS